MKKFYFAFSLLFAFCIASAKTVVSECSPPTATISYNSPFCTNSTLEYVTLVGTTGGTFSASSSGLFIDAATGDIHPNQSMPGTYVVTYIIPVGVDPAFSTTTSVTISNYVQPNFALGNYTYCPNAPVPVLPTTSDNGISGTWSPSAINNQTLGTSVYVFTPDSGQCSFTVYLTIQISDNIQPAFFFSTYNFCAGTVPVLPTTSNNGIHGTWSPSQITVTGICTFTPDPGQCATTLVETFSVEPLPIATISASTTVCQYGPNAVISIAANAPYSTVAYTVNGGANQTVVVGSSGVAYLTYNATVVSTSTVCLLSVSHGNCTAPANGCATATVIPYLNLAPIPSVSVCPSYTLPALAQGNYYTGSNGTGTMLHAGNIISTTQTIYVFAQNQCGSDEEYFYVNVYPIPIITPMPDVVACGFYSLPPNNEANYFSQPDGGGVMLSGGLIYSSQTVYLFAQTSSFPPCNAQDSFNVTIIPTAYTIIATQNNINYIYVDGTTVVQPLLLDSQLPGNYSYQWFELDTVIPGATSSTYLLNTHMDDSWHYLSVHATDNATGCITVSPMLQVYEIPVPAPVGDPIQTFTLGQTLADLIVTGSNVQWYDGAVNRNTFSSPLPLSTPLVDGVTYYASQSINGHESPDRLAVTVQISLSNNTFHFKNLTYSPNPVENVLNLKSNDVFKGIKVYNSLGQEVYQLKCNTLDLQLELGFLSAGSYFIRLESDKKQQGIKVIKK